MLRSPPNSDAGSSRDESSNGKIDTTVFQKLGIVILIGVHQSMVIVLTRYTRMSALDERDLFDVFNFVLLLELTKLILSCFAEYVSTDGTLSASIYEHMFDTPMDAFKLGFAAALYFVQNVSTYYALGYLSAPIFLVTSQARIATTMLFGVLLFCRLYTWKQCFCTLTLALGIGIAVAGERGLLGQTDSLGIGLACVSAACLSSSTANLFFDFMIKPYIKQTTEERNQPSCWMRNIQLSLFSSIIAGVLVFDKLRDNFELNTNYFFRGFTPYVWLLLGLQGTGGLLMSVLMKYADTITKGIGGIVSLILTTVAGLVLLDEDRLTPHFLVGSLYVLVAVYFFANPVPECLDISKNKSSEAPENHQPPTYAVELSQVVKRRLSGDFSVESEDRPWHGDRPRRGKKIEFLRRMPAFAIGGMNGGSGSNSNSNASGNVPSVNKRLSVIGWNQSLSRSGSMSETPTNINVGGGRSETSSRFSTSPKADDDDDSLSLGSINV